LIGFYIALKEEISFKSVLIPVKNTYIVRGLIMLISIFSADLIPGYRIIIVIGKNLDFIMASKIIIFFAFVRLFVTNWITKLTK